MVAARTDAWRLAHTHPEDQREWLESGRSNPCFFDEHVELLTPAWVLDPRNHSGAPLNGRLIVPSTSLLRTLRSGAGTNPERLSGETRARATGGGGIRHGRFT